jgi:hypothetical protein
MNNYQAIKDSIVQQEAGSALTAQLLGRAVQSFDWSDDKWKASELLVHQFMATNDPQEMALVILGLVALKDRDDQEELLDLLKRQADEILFAYAEQRVAEEQQQLTTEGDIQ